jgi:aldehyde dehydrogenase (NAD+)
MIYVGGQWRPSADEQTLSVRSPVTEQEVARIPHGAVADVDAAVAAARAALPAWSATAPQERGRYLRRLRSELAASRDAYAAAISAEMGAPLEFARLVQTGLPLRALGGFLDALNDAERTDRLGDTLVLREPIGVVAAITPFNYPLNQAVVKLAAALAAGCTVVLKPSEQTPLSALMLAETLHGIGLPPGVFNMVAGLGSIVGPALAGHSGVDMVSFTGSTAVGSRIAAQAAGTVKKVSLELGGKSAFVVLPDADLEAAVADCVASCLLNSGQTCTATTRLLVPRARLAEAVQYAAEAMAGYPVGDPSEPGTQLGPLVSAAARDSVLAHLEAARAAGMRVVEGSDGKDLPSTGYFVRPTVVEVQDPDSPIAQEELFGPVLCVIPYDNEDHALAIANGTRYGLAGAVWSADEHRAVAFARRMRTGRVDVNGGRFDAAAPFGGRGQSGVGYEMGRYGVADFQVYKSVNVSAMYEG